MADQLDLFAAPVVPTPPAPEPEQPEAEWVPTTLREHLTVYSSSEAHWESMAIHGATDADLAAEIECQYWVPRGQKRAPDFNAAALVPEVRALFGIPAQKVDAATLSAAALIKTAREEVRSWRGSGRSPLHERVNAEIQKRGVAMLTEAGWPTHDDAPYVNDHTASITSFAGKVDEHLDKYAAARGESRDTQIVYLIEHWTPVQDPAVLLPKWETEFLRAQNFKKPKGKVRADWEPYELTQAREAVELLKAEITRRESTHKES